jgi:hypothetical protein
MGSAKSHKNRARGAAHGAGTAWDKASGAAGHTFTRGTFTASQRISGGTMTAARLDTWTHCMAAPWWAYHRKKKTKTKPHTTQDMARYGNM